jgi:hypothetical protein
MKRLNNGRRIAAGLQLVTVLALAGPAATQAGATAAKARHKAPVVSTGAMRHARGSSAELLGDVNPEGAETTYQFQYGPTTAHGSHSPSASVGAGLAKVKVGQMVSPILPGYHYRLAATNSFGTTLGRDKTYTASRSRRKLTLVKSAKVTVLGSPLFISGTLSGSLNAARPLVLQASPYPFLAPFVTIGTPALTNAGGGFSFRVTNLTQSTQFHVITLDPRPSVSPVITVQVSVRVTLHVRSSPRRPGFVHLYGTVTPAEVGSHVLFRLQVPTRPGRSQKSEERTSRFGTRFSAKVIRAVGASHASAPSSPSAAAAATARSSWCPRGRWCRDRARRSLSTQPRARPRARRRKRARRGAASRGARLGPSPGTGQRG